MFAPEVKGNGAEGENFLKRTEIHNMPDQNLVKQVQRSYERMKHGKIKGFLQSMVVYAVMVGVISLFLGNPLPHRETILFFSVWDSGWIYTCMTTCPYMLVPFCAAGLALSLLWLCIPLIRDMIKFHGVLLKRCDAQGFLELMEYGVSYGRDLKFKGYQSSVFLLLQQRLAPAMIASGKLEECHRFLSEEWIGKKKSSIYKYAVMNLELVEAYCRSDIDGFHELLQKADAGLKKQKLFFAEQMFLEQKYEQALVFLKTYKTRYAYYEVMRQYLMGKCYDKAGNRNMAEACMRYVAAYGNTLPCREGAQEWLSCKVS